MLQIIPLNVKGIWLEAMGASETKDIQEDGARIEKVSLVFSAVEDKSIKLFQLTKTSLFPNK